MIISTDSPSSLTDMIRQAGGSQLIFFSRSNRMRNQLLVLCRLEAYNTAVYYQENELRRADLIEIQSCVWHWNVNGSDVM
jgi:hypothetical protein